MQKDRDDDADHSNDNGYDGQRQVRDLGLPLPEQGNAPRENLLHFVDSAPDVVSFVSNVEFFKELIGEPLHPHGPDLDRFIEHLIGTEITKPQHIDPVTGLFQVPVHGSAFDHQVHLAVQLSLNEGQCSHE